MGKVKDFPFEKARRITKEEVEAARKAIEKATGKKRPHAAVLQRPKKKNTKPSQ